MCVTHGMPCVTMHGLLKAYIKGVSKSICVEGAARTSPWEQARRRRRKGKEEGRKGGKEKRKGGKEKRKGGKGGKGKKKREEEMGGREEKERGKRKECCAVSRP